MLRLLFALCLLPHVAMAANEGGDGWLIGVRSGHPGSLRLHLDDDVVMSLGATRSAPDYWCEHDTSTTPDELACWTTDSDGGGTNIKWLSVPDGTDDPVFSGQISLGAGTVVSSPDDGDLLVTNNTGTQGIYFNTQTANALGIRNQAGSSTAVFGLTALYFGSGVSALAERIQSASSRMNYYGYYGHTFYHIGDMDIANRGLFEFGQAGASYEITGSSDVQYGMSLGNASVPFEVAQSATAGYHALHIDVSETSLGSGDHDLINAGVGGSEKFAIDDAGDMTITGTIKTEVASGAAPTEPHACDAAHSGVIVTVDDTDDTAYNEPCVCLNLDGTGYDWRQLNDVTGTACPSF